jgi:hypothetical protein
MRVGLSHGAKAVAMNPPDLRSQPPRRWNVAVDGVIWLPRMIDKARAFAAGTLGSYLFGQSPVDDALLRQIGPVRYPEFAGLATAHADDAAVLAAIEARSPGATARLQRWSDAFARDQRAFLALIDWDDGYADAQPALRIARRGLKPAVDVAMALLKRVRPVAP